MPSGYSFCFRIILLSNKTKLFENRPSGNASLPDYFFLSSLRDMGTLGDSRPGNGIVAQALLSVSRRSASLFRPQGALGSSPPNP